MRPTWRAQCHQVRLTDSLPSTRRGQPNVDHPAGAFKFKPGWLATAAGSILEFQLDSAFPPLNTSSSRTSGSSHAEDATASLLLTYTVSYDGWGKAQVGGWLVGWLVGWLSYSLSG